MNRLFLPLAAVTLFSAPLPAAPDKVMMDAPDPPEVLPAAAETTVLKIEPPDIKLTGPAAYAQLLVTATLKDGTNADATRAVQFSVEGAAEISPAGILTPKGDGTIKVKACLGSVCAEAVATVTNHATSATPDYIRDVTPLISRMGCNAGTCHGAKDGKAGFKLSLRGYDPVFDIRAFTDDIKGRRTNVASPDDSLMLLKPTAGVPHEGGQVMKPGDKYYTIVRAWIAGGMKLNADTPHVSKIELLPALPVLQAIGSRQQFRVVATYADGLKRDVTSESFIESGNADIAKHDKTGLLATLRRGEAPVLARYEGSYASTVLTVMGDRTGFVWQQPPANNKVDEFVAAKLKRMKTLQSGLCSDLEFIRRIFLDLSGLPPSPEAIRAFMADGRDSRWKREELIDRLLSTDEFTDFWTNKWCDLLQVNSKFLGGEGARLFRDWIRGHVKANTPYDQFARAILTATGSNKENPAASYYKILREPAETMENTTHLFLATRFNCNKCHDHPFERWTQDQYYQMAAWFARVGLERDPASGDQNIGGTAVENAKPLFEKVINRNEGEVKHERTGKVTPPAFPYPVKHNPVEKAPRRDELAVWITSPDNQYFAASFVNRVWGYLTGAGLITPLDDIRAGNPPSNPELLQWLSQDFIAHGFDMRHLVRTICQSRAYQLSLLTNRWNEDDRINYSHGLARRLPAEVLYDSIHAVTGSKSGLPGNVRAAQLADSQLGPADGFLNNAGRPVRESACECERSSELQLGPIMALISGPTVGDAVSQQGNALAKLAETIKDDAQLISEIFLRILNRPPTPAETQEAVNSMAEIESENAKLASELGTYEAQLKPVLEQREKERQNLIAATKDEKAKYEIELNPRLTAMEQQRQEKIAAAKKALADADAAIASKVPAWEQQQAKGQTGWTILAPATAESTQKKNELQTQPDQSVLAVGAEGKQDYTITTETNLAAISGLRLEAMTDDRIPAKGPGRSGGGNFVLSEFEVTWTPASAPDWKPVKDWTFDDNSAQDFKPDDITTLTAEGGALKLTIKPNTRKSGVSVPIAAPAGNYVAEFRLKSDQRLNQRLYWMTQKDSAPADIRSVEVKTRRTGGGFVTVQFPFTADSDLAGLRLQTDNANVSCQIDRVRLFAGKPPAPQKLKFNEAIATYQQGGYEIPKAINDQVGGEPDGWAIFPDGAGKPQTAVFVCATNNQPVPLSPEGGMLKIVMKQQYPDGKHLLGRFRLSVTGDKTPLNFGLPKDVVDVLAVAPGQRTPEQTKVLLTHLSSTDKDLKDRKDALNDASKPIPPDAKLEEIKARIAKAEQPLPIDPKLASLRRDADLSKAQLQSKRLTAAQDLAWALINNPAFLFNY